MNFKANQQICILDVGLPERIPYNFVIFEKSVWRYSFNNTYIAV